MAGKGAETMELIVTPFTIEDFSPLSAADAYLIGNDNYGVRLAASFNLDGFEACVSKAHNLGKRLYVNVNKVFTQSEIQSVTPFLEYLKEIEVDGIFFSDFGVYTIAKRIGIANLLIYNSETQLVNPLDVEFMNSLGLQGQLISKDVTLKDIQAIDPKQGNIGMTIYGYYHLFYSKRKLVSAYFEKYLRDPTPYLNDYHLTIRELERKENLGIIEDNNGTNILSGEILNGVDYIADFIKQGYSLFLIDGIFENCTYLQTLLTIFRSSINGEKNCLDKLEKLYPDHHYGTGFYKRKLTIKDKEEMPHV